VACRPRCLAVVRRYDPDRDFVVQVNGADVGHYDLSVYHSWAALYQHNGQTHAFGASPPGRDPVGDPRAPFCLCARYVSPAMAGELVPRDLALRRRLKIGAPSGRGDVALLMSESLDGRRVTRRELHAVTAALRAAVFFLPLLTERPEPPPPYFLPFTFGAREETFELRQHLGVGKKNQKTVKVTCSFPKVNLAPRHWPWR
jgi:hypothetical protein